MIMVLTGAHNKLLSRLA